MYEWGDTNSNSTAKRRCDEGHYKSINSLQNEYI